MCRRSVPRCAVAMSESLRCRALFLVVPDGAATFHDYSVADPGMQSVHRFVLLHWFHLDVAQVFGFAGRDLVVLVVLADDLQAVVGFLDDTQVVLQAGRQALDAELAVLVRPNALCERTNGGIVDLHASAEIDADSGHWFVVGRDQPAPKSSPGFEVDADRSFLVAAHHQPAGKLLLLMDDLEQSQLIRAQAGHGEPGFFEWLRVPAVYRAQARYSSAR